VVQDSRDLTKQSPNPLSTVWKLDVKQLLDSQREALLVGHPTAISHAANFPDSNPSLHRDIVQTVKVRQCLLSSIPTSLVTLSQTNLKVSLVLNQLFCSSVKQSDMWIGPQDLLSIQLKN
jgi:hypothetical protein